MELEVRSRKASYSGMPGPLLGSLRTFIVNSMDIRPPEEIGELFISHHCFRSNPALTFLNDWQNWRLWK